MIAYDGSALAGHSPALAGTRRPALAGPSPAVADRRRWALPGPRRHSPTSAGHSPTLAVPDEVYRAARIGAAEEGRSVSALVADYLRSLSDRGAEFARLEAQQRRIQAQITRFSARDRLARDEVHERAVR